MIDQLKADLRQFERKEKVEFLPKFFKAGPGEYAEGDVFISVSLPDQRKIAAKYRNLSLNDLRQLLRSPIHEERQTALIILCYQYKKADPTGQKEIYDLYMVEKSGINNWDLVDTCAPYIPGHFLFDKDRSLLFQLANSGNLWDKRIAMLSTYYFIRQKDFSDTFKIAEILLNDKHDLIHKAVGWMLREVGNRDLAAEEKFLDKHYQQMPRTMLRYAIEKFTPERRAFYMSK